VLGKKYYIGLTDDYRDMNATGLQTFRVGDRGSVYNAVYGDNYISIDAPVFYMRDEVIIIDEFEFLNSLRELKDHRNATKDLCNAISAAEEPLKAMIDRHSAIILASNNECTDNIANFYTELDQFFFANLPGFAQNTWKLLKSEYHIFPVLRGYCGLFADKCAKIIEAVTECEKLHVSDRKAYIDELIV
jgi:hypothetical protein